MDEQNRRIRRLIFLILFAALLVAAIYLRLTFYGDIGDSISTGDTPKFMEAASLPFPTWEFFTSNRPATIGLVLKILEPASGYEATRFADPENFQSSFRALQPGLDRVAAFQTILAIFSWIALAIAFTRRLNYGLVKLAGTFVILAFAFTPQLADWDGVILSESISFSLFALLLALTMELSARIVEQGKEISRGTLTLWLLWFVAAVFWVFSRDTNAYVLLVTAIFAGIPLLFRRARAVLPVLPIVVSIAALAAVFVVQNISLYQSDRWVNPFFNNLIYNVFPNNEFVAYFEDQGMPVNEEILALQESRGNERAFYEFDDFMTWVWEEGPSAYARFLVINPRWSFTLLTSRLDLQFSENMQPYFNHVPENIRFLLIPFGSLLHLTASGAIAVLALLALVMIVVAWRTGEENRISLGWLFLWLFISELVLLLVSFFGDSLGVIRHTLVAVMPMRITLWLMLLVVLDLALSLEVETTEIPVD